MRDLRLARREVHVERIAERRCPGGAWVIQEPKSARSRRRVPILDDELLPDLGVYLVSHPRRDELDAPLWPAKFRSGPLSHDGGELWNAGPFYKHVFVPAVAAAAAARLHLLN